MNYEELKNAWKNNESHITNSLEINSNLLQHSLVMKISSTFENVKPIKKFTILIGILWVIAIDFFVVNNYSNEFIFLYGSLGFISLINKIAIGIYIYQLILIDEIDVSQSVLGAQKKLSELKLSTLNVAKTLSLQIPFFTLLHINMTMVEEASMLLLMLQLIISSSFIYLSIWLFVNIKMENSNKTWFRKIFNGNEWDELYRAGDFLDELKQFDGNK